MKLPRTLTDGLFLFAAVTVISMFMTGTGFSKSGAKITPQLLTSEKWAIPWDANDDECDGKGGTATFTADGRFTLLRDCRGWEDKIDASGSYKISGDKIILKVEKSEGEIIVTGMTLNGILTGEGSLKFDDPLGYVVNRKSLEPVKAGESFKLNGFDVISMGEVSGLTTSVIKVRHKPGTNSGEKTWTGTCDSDSEVLFKSIKKDSGLVIVARTKEKDKVGKWNNYWYYVKFPIESTCGGSESGWVFGEFVKIE